MNTRMRNRTTPAISREDHRVCGTGTCFKCGQRVNTNQENKVWGHNKPDGWHCLGSWSEAVKPQAVGEPTK